MIRIQSPSPPDGSPQPMQRSSLWFALGVCAHCGRPIRERKTADQLWCNDCLEAEARRKEERERSQREEADADPRRSEQRKREEEERELRRSLGLEYVTPDFSECKKCIWSVCNSSAIVASGRDAPRSVPGDWFCPFHVCPVHNPDYSRRVEECAEAMLNFYTRPPRGVRHFDAQAYFKWMVERDRRRQEEGYDEDEDDDCEEEEDSDE